MTKSTEVDNKNVYELLFLFEADVKLIQRLEKEKPKRNKVFNRGKKKIKKKSHPCCDSEHQPAFLGDQRKTIIPKSSRTLSKHFK